MHARQRGALWLLGALVVGRALDALDLPFERAERSSPVVQRPERAAPSVSAESTTSSIAAQRGATFPGRGERRPSRARAAADTVRIAINSASADELQRLPGVGPVLAARILAPLDHERQPC